MTDAVLLVFVGLLLVWSVTSARLARADVTGPALFLVAGLAVAKAPWAAELNVRSGSVKVLAEATLALVLFTDAARIDVSSLRRQVALPLRLLGIGLPLTIVAGLGIAVGLLELPWSFAGLLAASLAATDAALSASLVTDERLPGSIRQALNVESGLNDGIVTPVVLFFLAVAASTVGTAHGVPESPTVRSAVLELLGGAVLGAALGLAGAWMLRRSHRAGWDAPAARRIATAALAFTVYLTALVVHANGFVAAFVAGIALASGLRGEAVDAVELPELIGEVSSLAVWFVFGAALVWPVLEHLRWRPVLYAAISLTVVRMAPVALAMVGDRAGPRGSVFIGWFGPRGLASIVFALLIVETLPLEDPNVELVASTIAITVVLSAIAHGVTADPLTRWFARSSAGGHPPVPTGRARHRHLGPARAAPAEPDVDLTTGADEAA